MLALLMTTFLLGPTPQETVDPVTGVWKGLATDEGPIIPERGIPTSFWLRRAGERVNGNLFIQGFDLQPVDASFDSATGVLEFDSSYQGLPMKVKLEFAGEELAGSISGMGMVIALAAERISHEVVEQPPTPAGPVDVVALGDEAWAEDLEFLAAYLPQVHANAFHSITSEEWRRAIDELRGRLGELDGLQTCVALAQLVARVGDAHTEFHWREVPGFGSVPIRLQLFSDGLFVTAVDERWADALGGRVTRIGSVPTEQALETVYSLFAAENESWRRAKAPSLLTLPKLMLILGMSESEERLAVTIEHDPGDEEAFVIEAATTGNVTLTAPDPEYDPVARWQQRRGERYWFEVIDADATVYFAYNSCAEDPRKPMAGFIDEVMEAAETIEAERLVIDLRNNSGGNSAILSDHIGRLSEHPRLGQPSRLFALVGPVTYSSGMMNAHQLKTWANVVLVGEPTGGKPNSYGEVRSFRLPNSGMAIFYSTKYFQMLPDSDPPSIEPDVLVELSSEDFFSGHDPVLERVLTLSR